MLNRTDAPGLKSDPVWLVGFADGLQALKRVIREEMTSAGADLVPECVRHEPFDRVGGAPPARIHITAVPFNGPSHFEVFAGEEVMACGARIPPETLRIVSRYVDSFVHFNAIAGRIVQSPRPARPHE